MFIGGVKFSVRVVMKSASSKKRSSTFLLYDFILLAQWKVAICVDPIVRFNHQWTPKASRSSR
jgi:hypothetical protein